MRKLEKNGLRVSIYLWWPGKKVSVKKILPLLCGRVPSVTTWLDRAGIIKETMMGPLDDGTGLDMTAEYWKWHEFFWSAT
jgi:hypothetical protein